MTLAKVMDEYRMDCSNDVEMHEPGYIYRAGITGPGIKFSGIKPCFYLENPVFCFLDHGKSFSFKTTTQFPCH
jgi:hypothetical protein